MIIGIALAALVSTISTISTITTISTSAESGTRVASVSTQAPSPGAALHAPAASVARCRELEGAFDYKSMVTECAAAAGDNTLSRADRADVYRLLGIAYAVLGDDENALLWFTKLLVLAPESRLPADSSPKFREIFGRAQAAFTRDGKVSAKHTPPLVDESKPVTALPLVFDVTDKLHRVASARVRAVRVVGADESAPFELPLQRASDAAAAEQRFQGTLPNQFASEPTRAPRTYQVRYELVLESAAGDVVRTTPPLPPATLTMTTPEPEGDAGPWIWGTVGGVGALVVLAGGTAAGIWCFTLGPCRAAPETLSSVRVHIDVDGSVP